MKYPMLEGTLEFDSLLTRCDELLRVKGADYSGGTATLQHTRSQRLKSFYTAAERTGLTPMQVLSVLLTKHLQAIETFMKTGQVSSEPIEERIVDAMNYLMLLNMLIAEQRNPLQ